MTTLRSFQTALLALLLVVSSSSAAQTYEVYRNTAEQGDADAQYQLGMLLEHGLGIAKNAKEAAQWYLSAADQGHAAAQNNIAVMFNAGRGIPKSNKRALFWFKKAAEQGNPQAQYNLGLLAKQRGNPRDLKEAYAWLSVSAANGFEKAFVQRDRLVRWMTPKWTEQAQATAKQYWESYPSP